MTMLSPFEILHKSYVSIKRKIQLKLVQIVYVKIFLIRITLR